MKAEQQIKQDLAKYFQENNITDIEQGIKDLQDLLTPTVLKSNGIQEDSPQVVKAWTALQIKSGSPLRYYCNDFGDFGIIECIYDNCMFSKSKYHRFLHYNVESGLQPIIPEGYIFGDYLFYQCKFPKGFSFDDTFITSNLISMEKMFYECEFPEGFSLGDNFDTINVKNMSSMFARCKFPKGFSFGNKFNTSKCKLMESMFFNCDLTNLQNLGENFDTSSVEDMTAIFADCKYNPNFDIGNMFKFETRTNYMFKGWEEPYHVTVKRAIEKQRKYFENQF